MKIDKLRCCLAVLLVLCQPNLFATTETPVQSSQTTTANQNPPEKQSLRTISPELTTAGTHARKYMFQPLPDGAAFCRIDEQKPRLQSIQIVRIPLGNPHFRFTALLGCDRARGVERMDNMLKRISTAKPVAAINADYFAMVAAPKDLGALCGTMVLDSEIISCTADPTRSIWGIPYAFCYSTGPGKLALGPLTLSQKYRLSDGTPRSFAINGLYSPRRTVLYTPRIAFDGKGEKTHRQEWQSSGNPGVLELELEPTENITDPPLVRFGRKRQFRVTAVRQEGNSPISAGRLILALSTADAADAAQCRIGTPVTIDFGGSPELASCHMLLSARSNLLDGQGRVIRNRKSDRAPRTGAGLNDQYLYLLVADGRAKTYADGLTIDEMAEIFAELGCHAAVDFDGGGSSMLFTGTQLASRLYSLPFMRSVANALVVLRND